MELPVDVSELGELCSAELECPKVYHLAVKPETDHCPFPLEYYLVLDGAPISKEAKEYGTPLENDQGLVFSLEQDGSGAKIIEYEIFKYTQRQGREMNPIPRMTYQQYRTARKLVHQCCNYDDGNCLVLECVCVQSISYSLLCRLVPGRRFATGHKPVRRLALPRSNETLCYLRWFVCAKIQPGEILS